MKADITKQRQGIMTKITNNSSKSMRKRHGSHDGPVHNLSKQGAAT